MRTTPKYEFKKRELTDIADITATEDNWDKVEEELDNQDTALASHLADFMPHLFEAGGKTYRWGFRVSSGQPQFIYEEHSCKEQN